MVLEKNLRSITVATADQMKELMFSQARSYAYHVESNLF
jgi:hypothetical protein